MFHNKNLVSDGNATPELPSASRRIKDFPDNKFLRDSLVETHDNQNSHLLSQMQSSLEKQGIQLIMMNKDLNGIAVVDKNKIKR